MTVQGLDYYLSKADESNTDIQKSELMMKKSEQDIKAAQRTNIPDINAMAGYSYQNQTDIIPKNSPMIGLMLSWNLNDLLSNQQKVKQSKLQNQQAAGNVELTQKNIKAQVEKTYHQLEQAQKLIKVAKQAKDFREEQLKIEYDKRDAGLNTPLQVLEAEAETAKAEADYYGAKQSLNVYLADMNSIINQQK